MCSHKFIFPEDKPENYNPDGITMTGRCQCGATQISNGRRYMIEKWEHFLEQIPYGATEIKFIDKVL